jgi:hypothetical protein
MDIAMEQQYHHSSYNAKEVKPRRTVLHFGLVDNH